MTVRPGRIPAATAVTAAAMLVAAVCAVLVPVGRRTDPGGSSTDPKAYGPLLGLGFLPRRHRMPAGT